MILSCILVARHNHILVFSVFTSRSTSLLASNRASLLFPYGIYVIAQHIDISTDQELTYSIQFQSF